jgi:hypothetical protein
MKVLFRKTANSMSEALADSRTLSMLVARINLHSSAQKERRNSRALQPLLDSLNKLLRVLLIDDIRSERSTSSEVPVFIEGLPRWVMQVNSQMRRYVNPTSRFQAEWAEKRQSLWKLLESSIPVDVQEPLLTWRWKAELLAFQKMKAALENSQKKVRSIEEQLTAEEKRSESRHSATGLLDRIRIIFWSRRAREDEELITRLENEKKRKLLEISERLRECEHLAAAVAIQIRTTFVDCGDLFSIVFEELTRQLDKEIKTEIESYFQEKMAENEYLSKQIEIHSKTIEGEFAKLKSPSMKLIRALDGEWDKRLQVSQEMLKHEFMCLNSIEIEKQEEAVNRWKLAVEQMSELLKAAEESLLHGHGIT